MDRGIKEYAKRFEKRRHRRVPLTLPVVIHSLLGPIRGTTTSISVSGISFMLFTEPPDIGNEFDITLKLSDNREIHVTCEKVRVGKINYQNTMFNTVGVEFISMSSNDRKIIASLVDKFIMP